MAEKRYFTESAGAGAKCDHFKLGVRTRVRAHPNLDVRGACVRPKKGSQLTPCYFPSGTFFDGKQLDFHIKIWTKPNICYENSSVSVK